MFDVKLTIVGCRRHRDMLSHRFVTTVVPFPCNVVTVVTLSSWHNRDDSCNKSRYFNVKFV